jgi:hypothetical protein
MELFFGRAVVVGGSAGSRGLAPYFHEVEGFDRDDLPASAGSCIGAPQDRHSHGLLAGGSVMDEAGCGARLLPAALAH